MGGGKGSNKTTSSFKLPPEFIKAYNESLGLARQAIQTPYQPYTGQLVAGLTPGQQQGISNIQAAQGMALPAIQRGMGYTEEAARGITPELYNRFYSPYVRDVADTTFANLMESNAQQRSGLKSGAIQAGAFGGDRGGIAQAEMARQQNLGLGQTMSGIYNQGYGQAMGLAGQQVANLGQMGQQMAGLGTAAQGSALQGAQAQMAAGAQEQATAQAQLQAAYDQFLRQQSYPFQIAQYFANIAQGLGSTAGGTSTTTAPPPNAASQIIGGIGALGSLASGAGAMGFSDERMKENIEAVGKLNDGQTVYRYNFKGDPKTQIGLLAQEVEQRKPGSVTEAHGLKMVDYKGATDDAASSMGGVVTPDMQRAVFADGGVPFMPYMGGSSYIPEGKIGGGGGSAIPKAPEAYQDKGLSEDWQQIKPLTEDQKAGFEGLAGKVRAMFGKPEASALGMISQVPTNAGLSGGNVDPARYLKPMVDAANAPTFEANPIPLNENLSYAFARGGVAGRSKYEYGGSPMDEAMAEAEAMRKSQGVAAAEEAPKSNSDFRLPTNDEVEAYISEAARKRGIDPNTAIRVWHSEGATGDPAEAWQSKVINNRGEREQSYSPFQLYMQGGLGNEMLKTTGLSPADPRNWQPSVDFALDKAAEGGWGPWMGAKAIGLAPDAGLRGAKATGEYPSRGVGAAPAPSGYSDTQIMPVSSEAAPEGVAAAEKDRTPFSVKNLFASEDRPSIIESIIGRRLSPEARNAVLNASFALMAGRSPFFATNLGEAGKVGTQTYYNALQMKRELAKQQADIARQAFEAQTGRMGVEVQERNAMRQQAALVLPIVRNLISLGQPVPPYLMNLLEGAYPAGSPERAEFDAQISGGSGNMAAPVDVKALPGPQAVPVQEGTNTGNIGMAPIPPPATEGVVPTTSATLPPLNSEIASLMSKLPRGQNPYALLEDAERAKAAGDPGLYQSLLDQANKLMERYSDKGVPTPDGGFVPFPGSQESAARGKRLETLATGEATQVNEYNKAVSETQSSFTPRSIVVDGLRQALSTAETGKFAEFKADIVNAAASLGLANAEQIAEAEDIQVAMKYFAQGILDSGMKDKIGPQISNADLLLVAKGQGTVENLPVANRKIVGAMYGKLMYDRVKNAAFDAFVAERGGLANVTPTDIRNWERDFGKREPVSKYIEQGIANTPVAGEFDATRPEGYLKPGYKYVHPTGRIFIYNGKKEVNGQMVDDAEWVN